MDALAQAVMSEARLQADQVLAQAREKSDGILQNARQQAEQERQAILERARQQAASARRQAVATAQIRARTTELENREKLLQKVFETSRQQLPTIQQWSDYDKIAVQLLREAAARLGGQVVVVHADQTTLQCLSRSVLQEIAKELNVELQVKEPLQQGTGVVVEAPDGRRRYDNTLETRLGRMQDSLRNPVYHLLKGESL
jgi:vacuolar-type H+-ATPase subunit E/Vma4